jgi:hypothetical protein
MSRAGETSGDQTRPVPRDPFRGYNPIRYTPCPDEFFDRQLADMDDDELRVTLYSFRRTFGFKKTDDVISISQYLHGIVTRDGRRLDSGCGLKTPRQVLAGLSKAQARRTIFSAFFCKSCGGRVPDSAMIEEMRTQKLVNGEVRTYVVLVVPNVCSQCGRRLRGFEEKRYFLNVLDEHGRSQMPISPREGSAAQIDGGIQGSITVTDPYRSPSVHGKVHSYTADSPPSAVPIDTRNSLQDSVRQQATVMTSRTAKREHDHSSPALADPTTQKHAVREQWAIVVQRLQQEMTARNFAAWIQPIHALSWTDTELLLGVHDASLAGYLELRLLPTLERAAASVAGRPVAIKVVLLP